MRTHFHNTFAAGMFLAAAQLFSTTAGASLADLLREEGIDTVAVHIRHESGHVNVRKIPAYKFACIRDDGWIATALVKSAHWVREPGTLSLVGESPTIANYFIGLLERCDAEKDMLEIDASEILSAPASDFKRWTQEFSKITDSIALLAEIEVRFEIRPIHAWVTDFGPPLSSKAFAIATVYLKTRPQETRRGFKFKNEQGRAVLGETQLPSQLTLLTRFPFAPKSGGNCIFNTNFPERFCVAISSLEERKQCMPSGLVEPAIPLLHKSLRAFFENYSLSFEMINLNVAHVELRNVAGVWRADTKEVGIFSTLRLRPISALEHAM